MTTKQKIATQIQLIYSRFVDKGNESDVIDIREITLLVEQAINVILKLQVAESFKAGLVDVPQHCLIQYPCAVTSDPTNNRSYITLPAVPLDLPMSMGIWSISAPNSPLRPYIPIPAQDLLVFQGTNVSWLEGQVGYSISGKKIYFTKDITLSPNGSISTVNVELLVMDFSKFSATEYLPISPEVESSIISSVLEQIGNGRISQAELEAKKE